MRKKVKVHKVSSLEGHKGSVYALTGDKNGSVYSSGADGMVVQWDLSKPKDGTLLANLESSIYTIEYSEEYNLLVVGHNHEGIHVIDLSKKKEAYSIGLTNCKAIYDIKIFKDSVFVLTQSGFLFLVDLVTKNVTKKKVSEQSLRSMVITSDSFVIGCSDNTMRVLSHKFEEQKVIADATKSVFSISSLTPHELISCSRDCHLRTYDLGYNLKNDIVAHMYAINHSFVSPDRSYFATASMDHTIKIWDSESKQLLKVIDKTRYQGHSNSVNRLFWSHYNNLLVSCSDDRTLSVWDLEMYF